MLVRGSPARLNAGGAGPPSLAPPVRVVRAERRRKRWKQNQGRRAKVSPLGSMAEPPTSRQALPRSLLTARVLARADQMKLKIPEDAELSEAGRACAGVVGDAFGTVAAGEPTEQARVMRKDEPAYMCSLSELVTLIFVAAVTPPQPLSPVVPFKASSGLSGQSSIASAISALGLGYLFRVPCGFRDGGLEA